MTIDEALNQFCAEIIGSNESHYEIWKKAKLALLEIIKGVKPEKKKEYYCECCAGDNYGFDKGVETYEKAIEEMFK